MKKRIRWMTVLLALLLLTSALLIVNYADTASDLPTVNKLYTITNKGNGLLLTETQDATFDPPYDTLRVVLDEANGSDSQKWRLQLCSVTASAYNLVNYAGTKALHRSARLDTRTSQSYWVINNARHPISQQSWSLIDAGNGYFRIKSNDNNDADALAGQYLTATAFDSAEISGTKDITSAPYQESDSQLWKFELVDTSQTEITENTVKPIEGYPLAPIKAPTLQKPYLYSHVDAGSVAIEGYVQDAMEFIMVDQLDRIDWTMLVDQFRYQTDAYANGFQQWKSEFWGKLMRGATFYYQYTQDEELYELLEHTVMDLLSTQEENGRICAYPQSEEFVIHDLWCRKYTMLGLEYFYGICKDEAMKAYILKSVCIHADYILDHVGPGKLNVVEIGEQQGISPSSILEPFVKLYKITGYERYLDFAEYIIAAGGSRTGDIFTKAYENDVLPYQYASDTHGYAMTSCFSGLVEYVTVTGDTKWYQACLNYAYAVMESEITVIGSGGANGAPSNRSPEYWNYTAIEQANPAITQMQETCVTVAWMQYLERIFCLTGDAKLMDYIERSLYNALLGAMQGPDAVLASNDSCNELSWDYFNLMCGTRNHDFPGHIVGVDSCCSASGLTGISLIPFLQVMNAKDGPMVNLYNPGTVTAKTPSGKNVTIAFDTDYPIGGDVKLTLTPAVGERFSLKIRIPSWSSLTTVTVNGQAVSGVKAGEYLDLTRQWAKGDTVEISFDMTAKAVDSPDGSATDAGQFIAIVRGPIVLSRDARFDDGSYFDGGVIKINADGSVNATVATTKTFDNHMEFVIETKQGGSIRMTDYASAGSTWQADSAYATWLTSKSPAALTEGVEYYIICGDGNALAYQSGNHNIARLEKAEDPAMIWTLEKANGGYYLKNKASGRYLAATGFANYGNVYAADQNKRQVWVIELNGLAYTLTAPNGKAQVSGSGNDSNVHIWEVAGSALQLWTFTPVKDADGGNSGGDNHTSHAPDGKGWYTDADSHYYQCTCGIKLSDTAHSFTTVIDKEPSVSEEGSCHRECTVCHYKESAESIDKLTPSEDTTGTTNAPSTPNTTDSNGTAGGDKDDGGYLWVIFISIGVILAGAGTALYFLVFRKR